MNKIKIAFVSDFDGTITDDDFFNYVIEAYLSKDDIEPWRQYRAGKKTHFNALKEIFAKIHVDEKELQDLISKIKVDKDLDKVWLLCSEKGISLYVCSAGNDYYIKPLIGDKMKKYDVRLIANKGSYNKNEGLVMETISKDSPYYDESIGISKYKIVKRLKDDGYFVIFAGDGPPDIEPAKIADVVFAQKFLLEECQEMGIETKKFDGFSDILEYVEEL